MYFDHSVHIAKDLTVCNAGDVSQMTKVKQVERTTMGKCVKCHRGDHKDQPGITNEDLGPKNCSTCHR